MEEFYSDTGGAEILEFSEISCGVHQLVGVHDLTERQFLNLVRNGDGWRTLKKGITYLFSDNRQGNGRLLPVWIRKHHLGTVSGQKLWSKNPNSGKLIKAWMWRYNGRKPR